MDSIASMVLLPRQQPAAAPNSLVVGVPAVANELSNPKFAPTTTTTTTTSGGNNSGQHHNINNSAFINNNANKMNVIPPPPPQQQQQQHANGQQQHAMFPTHQQSSSSAAAFAQFLTSGRLPPFTQQPQTAVGEHANRILPGPLRWNPNPMVNLGGFPGSPATTTTQGGAEDGGRQNSHQQAAPTQQHHHLQHQQQPSPQQLPPLMGAATPGLTPSPWQFMTSTPLNPLAFPAMPTAALLTPQQQAILYQMTQHLATMASLPTVSKPLEAVEPFRIEKSKDTAKNKAKARRSAMLKRRKKIDSDDEDDPSQEESETSDRERNSFDDYDEEVYSDNDTDVSYESKSSVEGSARKRGRKQATGRSARRRPLNNSNSKQSMVQPSQSALNRPRRAVQERLAGNVNIMEEIPSDEPVGSEYNGEQRLAIEFESLGELTNPPERLGKKGVIPDGLSGSFIMYTERWYFQITFVPESASPANDSNGSLPRYRCIEWRIRNELWKEFHTVAETYEDALKRNMRGVSLCNRVFTDAMELRAKEFEKLLQEERAKAEPDAGHIAFLESRVSVFRPKRFSEGPLLFGLRHKAVQRREAIVKPYSAPVPVAEIPAPAAADPEASGEGNNEDVTQ